jgi:hypothetical protein
MNQPSLGQNDTRIQVLQQTGEALLRVIRVERHISATRLQYGYYPDHHFERPLHTESDRDIRADTPRPKLV